MRFAFDSAINIVLLQLYTNPTHMWSGAANSKYQNQGGYSTFSKSTQPYTVFNSVHKHNHLWFVQSKNSWFRSRFLIEKDKMKNLIWFYHFSFLCGFVCGFCGGNTCSSIFCSRAIWPTQTAARTLCRVKWIGWSRDRLNKNKKTKNRDSFTDGVFKFKPGLCPCFQRNIVSVFTR